MDQQSLRIFLAVADSESFTRAAEQLYLTQPAISKRIAGLESQLNSRLFDRIGHNIQLTASGKLLKQHAQKLLQDMAFARQQLRNLSGEAAGPLQIATGHHIGLHRLPSVWTSISQNYPDIELQIHFMDSEQAYEQVIEGNMECAVVTLPEHPAADLTHYPLWQDDMAIYCSSNSPLRDENTLKIEELMDHTVILPEKHTFTRQAIIEHFKQRNVFFSNIRTGDYLETIKVLVECGLGWSVLPTILENKRLTRLLPEQFSLTRTLGLIHHKKRPLSNAAKLFLTLMQKTVVK